MLLLSAVTTLVALPVAGFAIAGVLERFVTQNVDARLDDRLNMLRAVVRSDATIDRPLLARITAGPAAAGDMLWRIETPAGAIGNALPPVGREARGHRRPHPPGEGPPSDLAPPSPPPPDADEGDPFDARRADGTRLHGRSAAITSPAGPVRIVVAVPRWQIEQPLRMAMLPLFATLAVVAVALAAATWVQLRVGLAPLHRLRDRVAGIRSGQARSVPEDQPAELRPLAIELNALVRDNDAALATARASAANLAHALKTPVATLALDLADDPRGRQVARIDATIRHHLSRARGGVVDRRSATPLRPAIDGLVAAVGAIHRGSGVTITATVAAVVVAIDAADLDELAGNLIDNAVRHARAHVTVAAVRDGATVTLTIIDDGPGIPAADRSRATDPGVRLDERGDGHGFGLAIARDLAALYGGTLMLDEAPGGGLLARVTLPATP
jgi:signal transduction histidine kinase